MDMNGVDGKTNFFEQRVTEYKRTTSAIPVNQSISGFSNFDDNDEDI